MKDVPQFLQRPAFGGPGGPNRGNLSGFTPGQGAPAGQNPNREQPPLRNRNRTVPN